MIYPLNEATSKQGVLGSDNWYVDWPSVQKFDKQAPFMEQIENKNFLKIIVIFLSLPWLLLPNFKQIQWNPTVYHAVFLYELRVHSIWPTKTKFMFAHTNTTTLLLQLQIFTCLLLQLSFNNTLPAFSDLQWDSPHVCLALESGWRFGARVMSYWSMWTVYCVYY